MTTIGKRGDELCQWATTMTTVTNTITPPPPLKKNDPSASMYLLRAAEVDEVEAARLDGPLEALR